MRQCGQALSADPTAATSTATVTAATVTNAPSLEDTGKWKPDSTAPLLGIGLAGLAARRRV